MKTEAIERSKPFDTEPGLTDPKEPESWLHKPMIWLRQLYVYRRVVAASFVASLGAMVSGAVISYTSPALPDLNSRDPVPFRTTDEQTSWIGSVVSLGSMVGALLCGIVTDRLGRQQTLVVGTVPFFVGWVIVACAPSFAVMIVGRIVTGFFKGLMLSTVGVYISEVSPTHIRGKLGTCQEVILNIGNLYTYIVGAFLPWNWLAIACGGILVVMELLLVWFPETPRWLAANAQAEKAKATLSWLRESDNVDEEFAAIQQSLQVTRKATPYRDFFRGPLLRPLIISQGLALIQQLSGTNVIKSYTVDIFTDAGTDMDPNVETIIIGFVGVCGCIISALVVEIVGRRALYIVSTLFMCLSMLATGVFFYIQSVDRPYAQSSLGWLPITSLVVYNFAFSLACGPLLYVMTCELFPTEARQRASAFAIFTQGLCGFIMTKYFVDLEGVIGEDGAFFVCSGICFLGLIFIIFMLPETKGKSLEELQEANKTTDSHNDHQAASLPTETTSIAAIEQMTISK